MKNDGYVFFIYPFVQIKNQEENILENQQENILKENEERKQMKPKKKKGALFGIICLTILSLFFVISLILAILQKSIGNDLLFFSGIFDILAAVILFKVVDHRMKYTCPECGQKRIHHRALLSTENRISSGTTGAGPNLRQYRSTQFYYNYEDTYECPNCGETYTVQVRRSGGKISEYSDGQIIDNRIAPSEF